MRLALPLIACLAALPAHAESCPDPAMATTGLAQLSGYDDVLSDISCEAPTITAHKLLCENDALWQMALLDSRAWVYAYENATKTETDRTAPPRDGDFIALRDACTDESCLCAALTGHTNDSMGGLSPYPQ